MSLNHNNNIAANILRREVIKQRNRTNAITMVGLFLTWLMELSYYSLVVILMTLGYDGHSREIATIIKMFEFSLVPLVQIMTSPPLRRFGNIG